MEDSEALRLFVSISLPAEVRRRIELAQAELRQKLQAESVRWARPDQFHLTLRFLGDVPAGETERLTEALRLACRDLAPLRLRAHSMGCFPNLHRPRVLWAGVSDEHDGLVRLHQAVTQATMAFSREKEEERFIGHITLARLKAGRGEAGAVSRAVSGRQEAFFGEWTCPQIELMRSELLPQGARHSVAAAIALGRGGVD